jgi:hypothetical protein
MKMKVLGVLLSFVISKIYTNLGYTYKIRISLLLLFTFLLIFITNSRPLQDWTVKFGSHLCFDFP